MLVYHVANYAANSLSPMPVASYIHGMARARAKHGGYIFQRPGSKNLWIKLRSPGEKRKEHSLHTVDRREAEILRRATDNRTQGRPTGGTAPYGADVAAQI